MEGVRICSFPSVFGAGRAGYENFIAIAARTSINTQQECRENGHRKVAICWLNSFKQTILKVQVEARGRAIQIVKHLQSRRTSRKICAKNVNMKERGRDLEGEQEQEQENEEKE